MKTLKSKKIHKRSQRWTKARFLPQKTVYRRDEDEEDIKKAYRLFTSLFKGNKDQQLHSSDQTSEISPTQSDLEDQTKKGTIYYIGDSDEEYYDYSELSGDSSTDPNDRKEVRRETEWEDNDDVDYEDTEYLYKTLEDLQSPEQEDSDSESEREKDRTYWEHQEIDDQLSQQEIDHALYNSLSEINPEVINQIEVTPVIVQPVCEPLPVKINHVYYDLLNQNYLQRLSATEQRKSKARQQAKVKFSSSIQVKSFDSEVHPAMVQLALVTQQSMNNKQKAFSVRDLKSNTLIVPKQTSGVLGQILPIKEGIKQVPVPSLQSHSQVPSSRSNTGPLFGNDTIH